MFRHVRCVSANCTETDIRDLNYNSKIRRQRTAYIVQILSLSGRINKYCIYFWSINIHRMILVTYGTKSEQ